MLRYLMAYPKKNFRYLGPYMWFSNRINWIISEVQASKIFFFIFLASKQLPAALGNGIGTGSVFCLSFSFLHNVIWNVQSLATSHTDPGLYHIPSLESFISKSFFMRKEQWDLSQKISSFCLLKTSYLFTR